MFNYFQAEKEHRTISFLKTNQLLDYKITVDRDFANVRRINIVCKIAATIYKKTMTFFLYISYLYIIDTDCLSWMEQWTVSNCKIFKKLNVWTDANYNMRKCIEIVYVVNRFNLWNAWLESNYEIREQIKTMKYSNRLKLWNK